MLNLYTLVNFNMDVSLTTIPIGAINWGQSANDNWTKIQQAFSSAISNIAVSAGNGSSNFLSYLEFSNTNGVSFGLSGSVITASHNGITTQTNPALSAANGSFTFQTLKLVDANGLAWSTSSDGLRGYYLNGTTISSYENQIGGLVNSQTQSAGQSTSVCAAFLLPQPGSFDFLRLPVRISTTSTAIASTASSANASAQFYSTWQAVAYSLGTGASSQSLVSVASGSCAMTYLNSVSIAGNGTQYTVTQALSQRGEGSQLTTSTQYNLSSSNLRLYGSLFEDAFASVRMQDIDFFNSLAGGNYWLVLGISTSSATNSTRLSALTRNNVFYTYHYAIEQAHSAFARMGETNWTSGGLLGAGKFTTAGGSTVSALGLSDISSTTSNVRFYFQLLRYQ